MKSRLLMVLAIVGVAMVAAQPARADECKVTPIKYVVDGKEVAGLSEVRSGTHVFVTIKVEGCDNQPVALASYTAPTPTWEPARAGEQVLHQSSEGRFDRGIGELDVHVPDCFYQVDLAHGESLSHLREQRYGDRLIEAATGGRSCLTMAQSLQQDQVMARTGFQVVGWILVGLSLLIVGFFVMMTIMVGRKS